jgi:hypothetical protein
VDAVVFVRRFVGGNAVEFDRFGKNPRKSFAIHVIRNGQAEQSKNRWRSIEQARSVK